MKIRELIELLEAVEKDHPDVDMFIRDSFRNDGSVEEIGEITVYGYPPMMDSKINHDFYHVYGLIQ